MKKNLYEVLQVSTSADAEIIEAAFSRLKTRLQANPSLDAQNDLKILQIAFDTLSSPEKRAAYDRELLAKKPPDVTKETTKAASSPHQPPRYRSELAEVDSGWWKTPKATGVIVATVLLIAAGLVLNYAKDSKRTDVGREQVKNEQRKIEVIHRIETRRVDNEGTLVQRSMDNQGRIIDLSSDIANKNLNMMQQAEEMRRRQSAERMEREREMHEMRMKEVALQQERRAENQRRYDEERAAAAARAQLERDRAELCRMERNRYGRSISC